MKLTIPVDAILKRYRVNRRNVQDVLGITDQAVAHWATGFRKISPENAIKLESLLQIPRWEMRPDLWPKPASPPKPSKQSAEAKSSAIGSSDPTAIPSGRRSRGRSPGSAEAG